MGGGLMQLVAYGAQDVYLTGNPQITFWKVTYRRYTNFAMESIEQTFNGQADFGRRVTCTISRNGDLAYSTYLQITLPEIGQSLVGSDEELTARWLDYVGEQIIQSVDVEIGGQRIDKQYGDWMHIWNQLTIPASKWDGYCKMVGQTTQLTYCTDKAFAPIDGPCTAAGIAQVCAPRNALPETTLYVPLQFWFCTNPGLALPLIALQYHEVKINLDLRPIDECLWAIKTSPSQTDPALLGGLSADASGKAKQGAMAKASAAYAQSLVAASLYVDYVFLDTDERRRMAQNPHEYLIEQLQFTGDESVGSSSNKIKLNFNHPCKELVWVVQPDKNVDYCGSLTPPTATDTAFNPLFEALGAQPFNYTDAVDALPSAFQAYQAPLALEHDSAQPAGWDAPFAGSTSAQSQLKADTGSTSGINPFVAKGADIKAAPESSVSDAGSFVLAETALSMHCWGENPVVVGKLMLNGQDRFSEREGSYFDLVQPFQYHTRTPDTGINVYSFALRPEEHQPSGSCNFSRIDNATLQLVLSNNAVGGVSTAKVRVYATNYNVLRIMSGMGGLAYSN